MELLTYWALPFLICMLLMIRTTCLLDKKTVSDFSEFEWISIFAGSFFYPLGIMLMIAMFIASGYLTKPISEIWKK